MNVVRTNIYCKKLPSAFDAEAADRLLNRRATRRIQRYGRMEQKLFVVFSPIAVWRDPRSAVCIIVSINAAALVAVKPSAVTTEREENRRRYVGIIPHCVSLRVQALDRNRFYQDKNPVATARDADVRCR